MTITNWDFDTSEKEIVEHLLECHSGDFKSRISLNDCEFKEEHFPKLLKQLEDKRNGYLSAEGKKELNSIDSKMKSVLKYCEEESIPIMRVCDFDESEKIEWRICKPTTDQVDYLKFKRWFAIIEGLANKTLLQRNMIDELSLKEVLAQIQKTIMEKQRLRQEIKVKKRTKDEESESS